MEKNTKKKITSPVVIFIILGSLILALGIFRYFSSPVIFVLLGIVIFSAGMVRCLSLPVIAILAGIIIFNIGVVQYVTYLEDRYHSMLSNTIRLVDNVAASFTSLESDKMVKQLMSKLYILRMENESLRAQVRKSERELISVSQKEKGCQVRLDRVLGQKKECRESANQAFKGKQEKTATAKESISGNKGFLLKKN